MGYTVLRSSPRRRVTVGCVPGNAYKIISFNVGNNERTTAIFVSDLGLTTVIARITSTHAYYLRPTSAARHRLASGRLRRYNIAPSLLHFSYKVRSTSSVVRSVRRTLSRVWLQRLPGFVGGIWGSIYECDGGWSRDQQQQHKHDYISP